MVGDVHTERDAEVLEGDTWSARVALRFTAFTERWLPDVFGFVLVGTFLIFALGLATGESPTTLVDAWGQGCWSLIQFTLQLATLIIGGYAVAVSAPVARLIARMAQIPKSPRAAIAFTAAVAMISSYLNWAFSLIFTAILAKEIARVVRGVDYRALGAMAFPGLGTVWAQGLSGSAALQVAGPASGADRDPAVLRGHGPGGTRGLPVSRTGSSRADRPTRPAPFPPSRRPGTRGTRMSCVRGTRCGEP
ncbi:TIGR00366 family protein [Streptomyces hirsutus]|uniref:TIGR00366 family protein n=1 Tax=Streptomyces hirsutus TaxID=35620 RepID=UPI00332DE4EC